MRWIVVVALVAGCTEPASYQSRAANVTDGTAPPPRTTSGDEERAARPPEPARRVVQPRLVDGLSDVRSIHGTCAVRANGDVRCWGDGPAVPAIRGASAVAVGGYYGNTVCAIQRGRVTCWYPTADSRTEYRARGVERATRVTPGRELTCALVSGGEVWCWGNERPRPVGVSDAVDVACGYSDCCIAHQDGSVSCWSEEWVVEGCSDCAHPGSPRERVEGLEGIVSLTSDQRRFCAQQNGGATTCWTSAAGDDGALQPRGELVRMDGGETAESVRPIGQVDVRGSVRLHVDDTASWALAVGLSDVAELSDAECARLRDGRVVCWGEDERYAEDVLVDMPAEEPDGEGAADAAGGEATPIERTDAADDEGSMLPVRDF